MQVKKCLHHSLRHLPSLTTGSLEKTNSHISGLRAQHLLPRPPHRKKTTNRGIGSEDGTSQKTSFGVRPRASLWQQQKSSEGGGTPRLGQRRTYLGDDGET